MKYSEFQQVVDTLKRVRPDFESEIAQIEERRTGAEGARELSLSDHVKTMVYAQLSNNRPWEPIEQNRSKIDGIFHDYDVSFLKNADPNALTMQLLAIRCGNRQIRNQMNHLAHNISCLEKIQQDHGSIDTYYRNTDPVTVVKSLALNADSASYKLKWMGVPLVCEYLKGVGVDIVKPDTLLRRLLGRLGYSRKIPATEWEAISICREIGAEYGLSQPMVDTVLWQYCAVGKAEICTAVPQCTQCGAVGCPSRK